MTIHGSLSTCRRDENIFVIGSPYDTVGDLNVNAEHCQAIAQHLPTEIERIFDLSQPYDPGP